ncbi:MAG: sulfatase-like hydrolase/transferase [Vicinamibacterales bacterium]
MSVTTSQSSGQSTPTIREVWVMAVWTGLAGGLLEAAIAGARRQWYVPPYIVSPQVVWMIPVDALVFAGMLALVLTCLSRIPRVWRHVKAEQALFAFGLLAAAGPLFAIPRLHWAASLVGAAGCATQLSRLMASRPRTLRRGVPWLLGAAVLATAIVNGTLAYRERRQLAALPPAQPPAPNVMLVVLDTVRAQTLSVYGFPKSTSPELEKIAASGVTFDAAISAAPWTLPSHSAMFTGHLPYELSGGWREPLDSTYPTLAEALQAAGYQTGGFVSNVIYASRVHGLSRGFIHYEDIPNTPGATLSASAIGVEIATEDHIRDRIGFHRVLVQRNATEITDAVLHWVRGRKQGQPFFAFANYMDAHEPYRPPEPFASRFGSPREYGFIMHDPATATRPGKVDTPKRIMEGDERSYEAGIAYADYQIGRLVEGLRQEGVLDNTLLIVVADHGEHFGEHRIFGHGNSLYMPLLHVPLIMRFPPKLPAARRVTNWVTTRQLPSTVMDVVGLQGRVAFPGASLASCWAQASGAPCGEPVIVSQARQRVFGLVKPWYPLSHGDMQSVISDGYQYIWNSNGTEELYNLTVDPAQTVNLVETDDGKPIAARLKALVPPLPTTP